MQRKQADFLITILLLVAGGIAGFYLHPSNLILGLIYLGIPSLYLMLRERKNYKKIAYGVLLFGVLMAGIFDFIAIANGAWSEPRIMFSQLIINGWPIESVIGYAFMTLFVLVFYEHFLDDEKDPRLSPRHSKILLFLLLATFSVFAVYALNQDLLLFPWFYLKAGLAAIVFPILFAFYNPSIIKKFAPLAFFFFFVWLGIELVGVHNQNWLFPSNGQFVGFVNLFGIRFPFEEVFFCFMWYPVVVVAYYEYFVDDQK